MAFNCAAVFLCAWVWHSKVMTAATTLRVLTIDCDRLHTEAKGLRGAARRVNAWCQELYSCRSNNFDELVNFCHNYRNGLAASSSDVGNCVNDIGNTLLGKRLCMRWSPRGVHRVAATRIAVLDGRLTVSKMAVRPPSFADSRQRLLSLKRSQSVVTRVVLEFHKPQKL